MYPHTMFLEYASVVQKVNSTKHPTLEQCVMLRKTLVKAQDLNTLVFYIPQLSLTIDMEALIRMAKPDFNLIDYRLNDAELDAFEKWYNAKPPTFPALLAEFAILGYKVSFTHVASSEAWCISVTGQKDAKFNSGATLTTWSDDAIEGFFMAWFKVDAVFGKGVWKTKTQSRRG